MLSPLSAAASVHTSDGPASHIYDDQQLAHRADMAATYAQGQIEQIELECGLACDSFQTTKIGVAIYAPVVAAQKLSQERERHLSSDLVLLIAPNRAEFRTALEHVREDQGFTLNSPAHSVYDAHLQRKPPGRSNSQDIWLSLIDRHAELAPSQTFGHPHPGSDDAHPHTVVHAEAAGFEDAKSLTAVLKRLAVSLCRSPADLTKPAQFLIAPSIRYPMLHVERAAQEFTASARHFLV